MAGKSMAPTADDDVRKMVRMDLATYQRVGRLGPLLGILMGRNLSEAVVLRAVLVAGVDALLPPIGIVPEGLARRTLGDIGLRPGPVASDVEKRAPRTKTPRSRKKGGR